jgi:surfeit locus 1 family protein
MMRVSLLNSRGLQFLMLCLFFASVFAVLGVWQLYRLQAKQQLIAHVQARLQAAPVLLPVHKPGVPLGASAQYTQVEFSGRYLPQYTVQVAATTVLGAGFWVLTPLKTTQAVWVYVNRGFVPLNPNQPWQDPLLQPGASLQMAAVGSLRLNEPGGAFLRRNQPENPEPSQRWYSRDVQAMAKHSGLNPVAPYFIDLGQPHPNPDVFMVQAPTHYPVEGLTVVRFANNHRVYAITWFALMLLCLWGGWWIWKGKTDGH